MSKSKPKGRTDLLALAMIEFLKERADEETKDGLDGTEDQLAVAQSAPTDAALPSADLSAVSNA